MTWRQPRRSWSVRRPTEEGTPRFFGSFTGALFTGALTILAVFRVCMGASIDFRATPCILRKGGTLLAVRIGMAALPGVVFGHALGEAPVDGGMFAGLSTLAIAAAMNDTSGGLYMALMGQYGDLAPQAVNLLLLRPDLPLARRGLPVLGAELLDPAPRHSLAKVQVATGLHDRGPHAP
jgi:2-keto-3-deoxygluconate permease